MCRFDVAAGTIGRSLCFRGVRRLMLAALKCITLRAHGMAGCMTKAANKMSDRVKIHLNVAGLSNRVVDAGVILSWAPQ